MPEYTGGVISKAQVMEMYGVSRTTLWKLLNKKYFLTLKEIGYEKNQRFLSPKQFEKFKELYGEP